MIGATGVHMEGRCRACGHRTVQFNLWGVTYRACGACDAVIPIRYHQQEEPCRTQLPSS
jgi:hypothetical protein